MQLRISLHNVHVEASTVSRLVIVAEASYNGLESTSCAKHAVFRETRLQGNIR